HDFFTPQPVKDAAIFRRTKHLRESTTATTQLVLFEKSIPLASTEAHCHLIPGAQHQYTPPPLLLN
ncbi:hypothetical protein DFH08DRAFT_679968, partial [Mycena albidolilacea]